MADTADPFSQLNDIHLPGDPGLWPPAPGWWIVGLLGILLVCIAARAIVARSRAKRPAREFINRLNRLEIHQGVDVALVIYDISRLVKQFAIQRFGRESVAGLQGDAWLSFLDATTPSGSGFSTGYGVILGAGMYHDQIDSDPDQLRNFLVGWAREAK